MYCRKIALFVSIGLCAFASNACAQRLPEANAEDPSKLRAAEALGVRLYRHDRAAALATDALMAKRKFRKDKRVGGWLTEAREDAVRVSFIDTKSGDVPQSIFEIDVRDADAKAGEVTVIDPPRPLSATQLGAWHARETALKSSFTPCSSSYNSVILPSTDSGSPGWSVFLLPATSDANVVPFGGTYRFETDADGGTVKSSRNYTKSCIAFPREHVPKGAEPVGLYLTHLLDPIPTEAHVLLNYTARQPVYLMTTGNDRLWKIDRGQIKLVDKAAGEDSPK